MPRNSRPLAPTLGGRGKGEFPVPGPQAGCIWYVPLSESTSPRSPRCLGISSSNTNFHSLRSLHEYGLRICHRGVYLLNTR